MPKPLKIAVIGAGHWGPNLIRNFHTHDDSRVTWVSDLDAVRLAAIKNNYEGIEVSQDWLQVVQAPNVDAVVICTPTATHYAIASQALQAGKHVFVEKPLTTSAQTSEALVQLAEKRGLKLMVGHVFLFNPGIRYIKEALEKKELGDLHYLYATRTNLGPIRADVNALWDLAPHDISVFLYLLGQHPDSARGHGSAFINPPLEDVAFSTLHFPGGVLANLQVSWLDPKKVRQLVIVGSKKMLVFDDMVPGETVRVFDKNVGQSVSESVVNDTIHHFRSSIKEGTVSVPSIPAAEPLKNECNAFIDWLVRDLPNPSTGRFGAEVVYLLEAISESMAQGGAPRAVAPRVF